MAPTCLVHGNHRHRLHHEGKPEQASEVAMSASLPAAPAMSAAGVPTNNSTAGKPPDQTPAVRQRVGKPLAFVVGGVSGCGKSTVGSLLAQKLQCQFFDGDAYHSKQSIDKMKKGIPLADEDRWPWLHTLATLMHEQLMRDEQCVVACSALKQAYRNVLCQRGVTEARSDQVAFVMLAPTAEDLAARVHKRAQAGTHFLPEVLLKSQLADLDITPGFADAGDGSVNDVQPAPMVIFEGPWEGPEVVEQVLKLTPEWAVAKTGCKPVQLKCPN